MPNPRLPVPRLNAILICDLIITDSTTRKKSLIGVFEVMYAGVFPCVHNSLSVYVNFTDAEGEYVFKLEILDLESNAIVGSVQTPAIKVGNRLATQELALVVRGLRFEHEGSYEFQVSASGELLGQKSLRVRKLEKKPDSDQVSRSG